MYNDGSPVGHGAASASRFFMPCSHYMDFMELLRCSHYATRCRLVGSVELCVAFTTRLVGNGSVHTTRLSISKGGWLFLSVSKQRFVLKTHSRCSSLETKMQSRKESGCLKRKAAAEELGISQQPPYNKWTSENITTISEHLSTHVNDMHCAWQRSFDSSINGNPCLPPRSIALFMSLRLEYLASSYSA